LGRLLLAGHQALFNEALTALLTAEGEHEVVASCTGAQELVEQARMHRPDLVLVDSQVAGIGREPSTIQAALRESPGSKVLVVADDPDTDLVAEAVRAGAVGIVGKAGDARTLVRAARAALSGEGVVPRAMLPSVFRRLADGAAIPDPLDQLSLREREVLTLMSRGLDNARIAGELVISPNTVRTHVQNILGKLGVHSKLEATSYVMRQARSGLAGPAAAASPPRGRSS
jgi:DNA-binding NarL/FixJ family response regulator